jgi:formate dehydrogenase iron-sulfur subunit
VNKTAKKISRRRALKLLAAASVSAAIVPVGKAFGETKRYAKLADTFRCIGCKRCMSACKRWNKLEMDRYELITDRNTDLTANSWVVVNLRADSQNTTQRHYQHWACQHCERPACAGVCPVTAIRKLPQGPVVINENKCIGCRYCYQACPFKIPRFDFAKRVTRKCHLCYNRTPLLNYMKPACVAACPAGALSFDYRSEIIKEAKKRADRLTQPSYILGLTEAGGTDMITILPAEPKNMGLVVAPKKVVNHTLDKIRISASGFMAASVITGGMYFYSKPTKNQDADLGSE